MLKLKLMLTQLSTKLELKLKLSLAKNNIGCTVCTLDNAKKRKLEFSDTLKSFCKKNRAHTVLYLKNGSQIEIFSFLQILIEMLN